MNGTSQTLKNTKFLTRFLIGTDLGTERQMSESIIEIFSKNPKIFKNHEKLWKISKIMKNYEKLQKFKKLNLLKLKKIKFKKLNLLNLVNLLN